MTHDDFIWSMGVIFGCALTVFAFCVYWIRRRR